MNITASKSLLNLTPLPLKNAPSAEVALPADERIHCDTQSTTPAWAKAGTLALGLLACAGGVVAPAQAQQAQTQTVDHTAADLLNALSQSRQADTTHFYLHIGIIGQDVEISRDKAAENISAGRDVILRSEHSEQAHLSEVTSLTLMSQQETHIHSLANLQQLVNSESGKESQSPLEHLSKGLHAYAGAQGDYYYEMKDVQYNGAGQSRVKPDGALSPFEAAAHLLNGQAVAFTATPLADLAKAQIEGKPLQSVKAEVQLVQDPDELLSMPASFDSAREIYHPDAPWLKGPVERCFTTQDQGKSEFQCETAVLR